MVFYAAYLSEIFRAALRGVHAGQREGAQALGMSRGRTFGQVIMPQALRLALPGTATMGVDLLKSTSLLVTIAAGELMSQGSQISSETFRPMEVYLVIAAIYFAVCYPVSQLLLLLERRVHAGTPLTPARRRRMAKAETPARGGARRHERPDRGARRLSKSFGAATVLHSVDLSGTRPARS